MGEEARELIQYGAIVSIISCEETSWAGPWPLQVATESRQSLSDAIPYRTKGT